MMLQEEKDQSTQDALLRLESIIKLKADVELTLAKGIELYWIVDTIYSHIQVDTADFYEFLKIQAGKATKTWAETL